MRFNIQSQLSSTGSLGEKSKVLNFARVQNLILPICTFHMWSGHVFNAVFRKRSFRFFTILSYSVYCKTAGRFLVQWNIGLAEPADVTFHGFFSTTVFQQIPELNRALEKTYVGKRKELDSVNSDMHVTDAILLFGPYVKFVTEEIGGVEPVAGN